MVEKYSNVEILESQKIQFTRRGLIERSGRSRLVKKMHSEDQRVVSKRCLQHVGIWQLL